MRQYHHDPDGARLPIKIDNASNGEFEPIPLPKRCVEGNRAAMLDADAAARKIGQDRRSFLVGTCGAASTLLSLNAVNAAAGKTGSFFDVRKEARFETAAAEGAVVGNEFIFDVHGHYINPYGAWRDEVPEGRQPFFGLPKVQACKTAEMEGLDYLECLSGDQFVKDVFVDSDTDMMVLTFVPSSPDSEPLKIEEAEVTKQLMNSKEGGQRLLVHGRVNPNQDGDLNRMDELAENGKFRLGKPIHNGALTEKVSGCMMRIAAYLFWKKHARSALKTLPCTRVFRLVHNHTSTAVQMISASSPNYILT